MPNKTDAQILQVVCRQGRQDRLVDLIFAECRLVLFEAETPQPTPEIHNGVLTPQPRNHHSGEALFFAMTTMGQRRIPFWQSYASLRRLRTCRHIRFGQPSAKSRLTHHSKTCHSITSSARVSSRDRAALCPRTPEPHQLGHMKRRPP